MDYQVEYWRLMDEFEKRVAASLAEGRQQGLLEAAEGYETGVLKGRKRGLLEAAEEIEKLHARNSFRAQVGTTLMVAKALERVAVRLRQRAAEEEK